MKHLLILIMCLAPALLSAQQLEERPAYCDDIPQMYEKGPAPARSPLPMFTTAPVVEYKVQVAILKRTNPRTYPFHQSLVARWRPCEQVWVVETKETYAERKEAEQMQEFLKGLGYNGAYITECVGYQHP